jgi:hypothetical protein
VAENKPAGAVDACFGTDGSLLAQGDGVWSGILDDGPNGACTTEFPLNSSSRIVSGGPIEGSIFKCQLQSVSRALRRGVYGSWEPTEAEEDRLRAIFPTGVCDYTKPDAGLPREFRDSDDDDDD